MLQLLFRISEYLGLVPDFLAQVASTSSDAPQARSVLDGFYEANFVVVSVAVGVLMILALVYLVGRFLPRS